MVSGFELGEWSEEEVRVLNEGQHGGIVSFRASHSKRAWVLCFGDGFARQSMMTDKT